MAWKAIVRSIQPTLTPTDSFDIEVEYLDTVDAARGFRQSLHISAGQITSSQDMRDLLNAKKAMLTNLDQVKAFVATILDQQI